MKAAKHKDMASWFSYSWYSPSSFLDISLDPPLDPILLCYAKKIQGKDYFFKNPLLQQLEAFVFSQITSSWIWQQNTTSLKKIHKTALYMFIGRLFAAVHAQKAKLIKNIFEVTETFQLNLAIFSTVYEV